jgi:four helix bundle protein
MKSRIEDLEIYKTAIDLSDKIWKIVITWEKFEKNTVGGQLIRAIDSVGANLSEGYGRGSKTDNARFAKIARGSLFETKYWLILSHNRKLISQDELALLFEVIEKLLPRISSYINYLKK